MTVIAEKAKGIVFWALIVLLFGGVLVACGIDNSGSGDIFYLIFGIITIAFCIYFIVRYLRLPHDIIIVDDNGILHLPHGVTLDPADIIDVSYKRAIGKYRQYDWGKIILITHTESFKFDYVSDCEGTSKALTRMMYASKNKE